MAPAELLRSNARTGMFTPSEICIGRRGVAARRPYFLAAPTVNFICSMQRERQ